MRALRLARPLACYVLAACSPAGGNSTPRHEQGSQAGSASAGGPSAGGNAGTAASAGSPSANGGRAGDAAGGGGPGGSGNGGGSSASGDPCDGADIFCSDFEAAAIPPELMFYPEYLRATQTFVTLDPSLAHAGNASLKVAGTNFSQMLGVSVPSRFWGRVYLRSDTDIQEGHNAYVAAGTASGDPNDGTYIRIGEHQCQLELNRNTDDRELLSNGGNYACEGGVKLLKDTWYCLEFLYDGPGQETRVFVDEQEVTALHTTDWGVYDYKIFKLGYEQYHGAPKTLWYDDLALGSSQLHCP